MPDEALGLLSSSGSGGSSASASSAALAARNLHEQARQRREVALAEIRNGAKVGPVQPGHCHHVDPLLASASKLPRGIEASAVAVEKQRHHHPGMVRRIAPFLGAAVEDGREIEALPHRVPNEMRPAQRHKIMHRSRQKPALIHIP